MQAKALLLALTTLAGCRSTPPPAPDRPPPVAGMADEAAATEATRQKQRPAMSTELLPAFAHTGTLKAEAPLLQRPKTGSVILTMLAASQTVQILGTLENADGQWISVGVGDTQGWIRATQLTP
ncbi:MAG: hypothetical protein V4709_11470 [Pseudomonadota bacterium]